MSYDFSLEGVERRIVALSTDGTPQGQVDFARDAAMKWLPDMISEIRSRREFDHDDERAFDELRRDLVGLLRQIGDCEKIGTGCDNHFVSWPCIVGELRAKYEVK